MRKLQRCLCLLAVCLAACGSTVPEMPPDSDEIRTETVDVDVSDERADRPSEWRTRAGDFAMWIASSLEPELDGGRTRWTLRGRVGTDLIAARAYDDRGVPRALKLEDERTFVVTLDAAETAALIGGKRLYFDFFAPTGARLYHGSVRFAPRFVGWTGTNDVFVYRSANPVVVGDEVRIRGRAVSRAGFEVEQIYAAGLDGPQVFVEPGRKVRFDWTMHQLLRLLEQPDNRVRFRVWDGADRRTEKRATLVLRLVQLGVTVDAPLKTWPPAACEAETSLCLDELPDGDTEDCGWAEEVGACLGEEVQPPVTPTADRFVEDLGDEIVRWYQEHERDASAFGAPPLDDVLRRLEGADPQRLEELGPGESFDYDPEVYDIFWMPDPVFDGSDRVWYGVYEPSGRLHTIFVVN